MAKWKFSFTAMSLQTKLIVNFMISSIFLLVVGIIGYVTLNRVTYTYGHVAAVDLPKSAGLGTMSTNAEAMARTVTFLAIPGTSPETRGKLEGEFKEHVSAFVGALSLYRTMPVQPAEVEAQKKAYDHWTAALSVAEKVLALAAEGKPEDRGQIEALLIGEFEKEIAGLLEHLGELRDLQSGEVNDWVTRGQHLADQGQWYSIVAVIAGWLAALGLGFLFSRRLSGQLAKVTEDLSGEAGKVAQASRQISSTSEELSSSSTEQAASLQETTSALEQVSAMVQKNAENAGRSKSESEASQSSATNGKQVIGEMIRAIEEINASNGQIMDQVNESNRELSDIVRVIGEIGSKTRIINDIVFQTKLLSFNASVEAARAGENGKGFAVVAEEVGNLAQMSGNAAKEITEMLDSSIRRVENIVSNSKTKVERLITQGQEKVLHGSEIAKRCGAVLEDIVGKVSNVNTMVGEISVASDEQARGIQEINKAVAMLDQATQRNASVSSEAAGASEKLASQADALKAMVTSLKLMVEGYHSSAAPVGVRPRKTSKPAKARSWFGLFSGKSPVSKRAAPVAAVSKPAPVKAAPIAKVIPLVAAVKKPLSAPSQAAPEQRLAVGSENVPVEHDPRFEDI